ncbi:hypothetical protein [Saccharopolyspora spinosa]|uniref:hypothetical protein n=1 Tax=Saccharopolyspora spinosa TaxID=60894 RepID=UPI000237A87A|nr:hypothetical protein [Saccharopolyspora spinosa]
MKSSSCVRDLLGRRPSGRCGDGICCSRWNISASGGACQGPRSAFAEPPTGPNRVWQLDFSEFETTTGGVWRIAGCADYYSKYEFGLHLATTCNAGAAIAAVEVAITGAERLARRCLAEQLTDPATGKVNRITAFPKDFAVFASAHRELAWTRDLYPIPAPMPWEHAEPLKR